MDEGVNGENTEVRMRFGIVPGVQIVISKLANVRGTSKKDTHIRYK